jgi:hypothetical protein
VFKRVTGGVGVLGLFLALGTLAAFAASKKVGVLPFTRLDLTFIAASAIPLILVGGGLRILVRKSQDGRLTVWRTRSSDTLARASHKGQAR